MSYYTGNKFDSLDETVQYVRGFEETFLQQVENHRLFVPPGPSDKVDYKIDEAIQTYREDIRIWRSEQFVETYENLSDGELIWNGIFERLALQWHLLENSEGNYSGKEIG